MKIAIVTVLILAFSAPLLMADENRGLWSESNYIQSAKIHYQHVYKKSKLREDLYHCIDLIREAADRFGKRPQLYYMLGTFYAEINSTDTMVAYFDSVQVFCDDESIDKKYRKNCYKKDKYIEKMEKTRQEYWEQSYNDGVDYLGEYDTVVNWINMAPSEDSAKALDSIKNVAFNLSKSNFETALKVKPTDPRTYDGLAVLLEREEHHQEAVDLYKKAIEFMGENESLINKIAYAYIYIPDWQNAIEWFNKSLEKNPDDVNTLINLSVAYSNIDERDKWYEYTARVLELQPENTQFLFNAGQHWYMKMQEAALELSDITDSTENAETMRADLETKINECRSSSLKNFEEIIRINPQDKDALKRLGIIYLLNQQNQEAVAVLQDHVAIDSSDVDVLDFLGRAFINLGKMESAIRPYELLVASEPGSLDAWERLAELYKFNGMPEKAKEAETTIADLKKL